MLPKVKGKIKVAVLGYGSQGRAVAQNLRDFGYEVLIGLKPRSRSRALAQKDGFKNIMTIAETVPQAEIICLALPDYRHAAIFVKDIEKNLKPGATLWFLHGLSVHFGLVKPPAAVDVILLAPHAPGTAVREKFLTDKSVSAFYAVAQNKSGRATKTVFALAKGIGIQKKRLVKTTFEDEAVGDIFGEQAVLCGGLAMLIKNGFEVLVENGLKPENAYLEVAFQLDLIVQLIKQYGIEGMFERISVTARYGSLLAGPRIIDKNVKKNMESVLSGIKAGKFTRNLQNLSEKELKSLKKAMKSLSHPRLEKIARKYSK
ncbi:MAG: ketol-acid reductoisomerase [Candidatus Zixiibacteriota bacterium]